MRLLVICALIHRSFANQFALMEANMKKVTKVAMLVILWVFWLFIPTCVTFITHRTLSLCNIHHSHSAVTGPTFRVKQIQQRLKTENTLLELKSVPVNHHQSTFVDTPSSLSSQQLQLSVFRTPQGMFGGQQGYSLYGRGLSDINMLLLEQRAHHISMNMQLHELQTQYRHTSGPIIIKWRHKFRQALLFYCWLFLCSF